MKQHHANAQLITKDMTIASILESHPEQASQLAHAMTQAGLHCVGCGASLFETLEQGLKGHGMNEKDINSLLTILNQIIVQSPKNAHTTPQQIVTFTPRALTQLKQVMKQEKKSRYGIRVSVLQGGCAGFTYDMHFTKQPSPEDYTAQQDGITVYVDHESASFLKGSTIDYISTLNESGFKFNNPNSHGGCGCGKSFN